MKIKKYEAANMRDALVLIKKDLGPDAVILSTRKVMKNNNFGLFSKPVLEVTAASEYKDKSSKKTSVSHKVPVVNDDSEVVFGKSPAEKTFVELKSDEERKSDFKFKEDDSDYTPVIPKKIVVEPAYSPSKQNKIAMEKARNPFGASVNEEKLADILKSCGLNKFNELLKDIGEIKSQISNMSSGMSENMVVDLPSKLKGYFNIFVKNGVDNVIAYRFLKRVEKRLAFDASNVQIRELVIDMLADIISIAPDYSGILKKRIIALVGPTGVGKTTTIAKIAAALTLKHKMRVCLITVDNFRIGAVEQLKTYAEIVNIPLYVATNADEFRRVINEVEGKYDSILVDSMGRSQFDSRQIENIGAMLKTEHEITVALVLSLAANHQELADTLYRYASLSPDYLIFTKLDETKYFGPLINLPIMKRIPLLLVTTGQNVPDDMENPNGKKIAKKVLQEIPSLWSVK